MIGQNDIMVFFMNSVRNLCAMFDKTMSMKVQVGRGCQSFLYFELKRIGSIGQYLSTDATKTLVTSLVLSRLDYCNSLLAGTSQILIDKIQRVMNCALRLIHKSSKRDHITPLMINLHWPPSLFLAESV